MDAPATQGVPESYGQEVDRVLPHLGSPLQSQHVGEGHEGSWLLLLQRRIPQSVGWLRTWLSNEPIALASEFTTVSVLVGMSVTSLLHRCSKQRSVAGASSGARLAKGGSVTPMCSYCLAMATEEWKLRHDRDCPWDREQNRCRRCGYVTWWDEFVYEEQCACHPEGMTPDV